MEGMENDLTCCVCLEIFVYPLMLPCTHNLCRACVNGLTRDGIVSKFNCPNCRKEVVLDRIKGVDALPRNLALDNLANLFKNKAKLSTEKTCAMHKKTLDFYCQTCKSLVCLECVESKHTGFPHSVDAMKKLISEEKNQVLDLTEQLNDIEAELMKNVRTVRRYVRGIKLSEEANRHTVEQNLTQLVAALNTAKQAFVKKLQQDSQKEVDELEALELDYNTLLEDIISLRAQLGVHDSTDLVHQYTSYQNAKMRVSGFLAFKLVKVSGPPQAPPLPPLWRLRNIQEVYQAIQTLDVRKEPLSPVMGEDYFKTTSQSLPASPKHLAKPSVHQQNSQEYNSDCEGPGQGSYEGRKSSVTLMVPENIPESNRRAATDISIEPEADRSPSERQPLSIVSASTDFWANPIPRSEEGQILARFPTATAAPSLAVNSFQAFSGSFNQSLGMSRENAADVRAEPIVSSPPSSQPISGAEVSEAGGARPSLSSPTPSSTGGGARPKQYPATNGHCERPSTSPDRGDAAFVFSSSPRTVPPNECHRSPDNQPTSANVFENQTFQFTVGSSEKSRSRSRGSKGKKKRDLSAGRSNPRQ